MYRSVLALLFAAVLLLSGCAAGKQTVPKEKSGQEANMDGAAFDRSDEEITYMDTTENVIYLAGGCFWGMEQLMQSIPGVIDAESGYANGTCEADADYKTVCKGETGFRETVRVEYDPEQVSLDALLMAYFYVIDPTVQNRQGNDRGSQYQTGVYFTNESARETVKRIAEIERHVQTVQEEWASRGVAFRENERIRLITVFFHDKPTEEESLLFVGHVGVLLTAEDGTLYFVEKVAFQEPYRLLRFANRTALSDYLMGKYDTSWGQDTASPFIMENDKLMDGWRPNPDNRSSAHG